MSYSKLDKQAPELQKLYWDYKLVQQITSPNKFSRRRWDFLIRIKSTLPLAHFSVEIFKPTYWRYTRWVPAFSATPPTTEEGGRVGHRIFTHLTKSKILEVPCTNQYSITTSWLSPSFLERLKNQRLSNLLVNSHSYSCNDSRIKDFQTC